MINAIATSVPRSLFFTKGVGHHKDELRSFELALRDARIEKYNLVHVSSIIPPECKIVSAERGIDALHAGEIVFCVLARCSSNEPRRLLAATIGCAIPKDRSQYGYLSEHHAYGQNERVAGDYAEDLAASMLASTLGIEFDDGLSWDEKEQIWKISGQFVKTSNCTKTALVKRDVYTTVVSAAVLIF